MPSTFRSARACLAGVLLALAPALHAADDHALDISLDIYRLIAETTMIVADHDVSDHSRRAREVLERLRISVPPVIEAARTRDPALAGELDTGWQDLSHAYEGEPFGVAFRINSYDTNVSAHYTSGYTVLLAGLSSAAAAQAASSPEKRASYLTLRTLAGYMQYSTGIVGGTSQSANAEELDVSASLKAVDDVIAELRRRHAGSPAQARALARVAQKWQFIRPTFLVTTGQSTPFIVYKHGMDMVKTLEALAAKPSS